MVVLADDGQVDLALVDGRARSPVQSASNSFHSSSVLLPSISQSSILRQLQLPQTFPAVNFGLSAALSAARRGMLTSVNLLTCPHGFREVTKPTMMYYSKISESINITYKTLECECMSCNSCTVGNQSNVMFHAEFRAQTGSKVPDAKMVKIIEAKQEEYHAYMNDRVKLVHGKLATGCHRATATAAARRRRSTSTSARSAQARRRRLRTFPPATSARPAQARRRRRRTFPPSAVARRRRTTSVAGLRRRRTRTSSAAMASGRSFRRPEVVQLGETSQRMHRRRGQGPTTGAISNRAAQSLVGNNNNGPMPAGMSNTRSSIRNAEIAVEKRNVTWPTPTGHVDVLCEQNICRTARTRLIELVKASMKEAAQQGHILDTYKNDNDIATIDFAQSEMAKCTQPLHANPRTNATEFIHTPPIYMKGCRPWLRCMMVKVTMPTATTVEEGSIAAAGWGVLETVKRSLLNGAETATGAQVESDTRTLRQELNCPAELTTQCNAFEVRKQQCKKFAVEGDFVIRTALSQFRFEVLKHKAAGTNF